MIKVKASDVKTGAVLDEELRWSSGREGKPIFEKSFTNRDEAKEYCISMVKEHPDVSFWIYEENLEPERVVNQKSTDKKESPDQDLSNETFTNVKDKSYFIRHWRGELSLATSYWINTFLVSAVLTVSLTALLQGVDITHWPKVYSLLAIAMWGILYVVTPWQIVGCWRSSANHVRKTKRVFWPRVVQVLLVLGTIESVNVFFQNALPQIGAYMEIVLESDSYSKYTIRVLRQGTEIEISGGIGFGLTDDIKKHLGANPNIRVIHLNSIGGRVSEARNLRDLIRSRNLITYSSTGCFSACVWAFMGGTIRVLNKNAKLGFHQVFFPGTSPSDLAQLNEDEKQFFLSEGVDASFV